MRLNMFSIRLCAFALVAAAAIGTPPRAQDI